MFGSCSCCSKSNFSPRSPSWEFTRSKKHEVIGLGTRDLGSFKTVKFDLSSDKELDLELDGGGCQLLGDANGDATLNVLDVVLTVNLILNGVGNYEACSDINSDNSLNVLDVILLVNLVLSGQYNDIADFNSDQILNVLDVITLINIILE